MDTELAVNLTPPNPADLLRDFVTEPELAKALQITRRTLIRWYQERSGPPRTRVGKRILYRRAAVIEWLRAHEQRPCRSPRTRRARTEAA